MLPTVKCIMKFVFCARKVNPHLRYTMEWYTFTVQCDDCRGYVTFGGAVQGRGTEVHNCEWASRPSETIMEISVTAVHVIIEEDWRVTFSSILCDLQENHFIEISQGTLYTIIREHLNLSKFSMCWVQKDLTEDHFIKRMGAALHFLLLYYELGPSSFD